MNFLNKKQVKKLFSSIPHALDLDSLTIFQREKKLFLLTKAAASLATSSLEIRSLGLFLGTLDNKQVVLSPSTKFILK